MERPTSDRAPKCGSNHQPSATPPMIEPRLKKLDAIAGMPKTFLALSIPIASAATETSKMKGHMIRVNKIVSAVFSGDQLHHVMTSTSRGAKRIPTSVSALMKTMFRDANLFARRQADSSPPVAILFENVVM